MFLLFKLKLQSKYKWNLYDWERQFIMCFVLLFCSKSLGIPPVRHSSDFGTLKRIELFNVKKKHHFLCVSDFAGYNLISFTAYVNSPEKIWANKKNPWKTRHESLNTRKSL